MKENCIMSIICNALAIACFAATGSIAKDKIWVLQFVGFALFIIGIIGAIVFFINLIDRIDKLSKLDNICKKMTDLETKIYNSNDVLNDINKHICDGFNGIAEIISNK